MMDHGDDRVVVDSTMGEEFSKAMYVLGGGVKSNCIENICDTQRNEPAVNQPSTVLLLARICQGGEANPRLLDQNGDFLSIVRIQMVATDSHIIAQAS